jgi:hypothetical protein
MTGHGPQSTRLLQRTYWDLKPAVETMLAVATCGAVSRLRLAITASRRATRAAAVPATSRRSLRRSSSRRRSSARRSSSRRSLSRRRSSSRRSAADCCCCHSCESVVSSVGRRSLGELEPEREARFGGRSPESADPTTGYCAWRSSQPPKLLSPEL